jgi:transposase
VIVIGVDPHKQTHTAAAVEAGIGELLSERTVKARRAGFEQLLAWAGLGEERLWAHEDCRHVSVSLERFLLASGESVLRVPPKLMAGAPAAPGAAASRTRSTPSPSPMRRCVSR